MYAFLYIFLRIFTIEKNSCNFRDTYWAQQLLHPSGGKLHGDGEGGRERKGSKWNYVTDWLSQLALLVGQMWSRNHHFEDSGVLQYCLLIYLYILEKAYISASKTF